MKHKKEREKLTGAQMTLCIVWAMLHARQFIRNHTYIVNIWTRERC